MGVLYKVRVQRTVQVTEEAELFILVESAEEGKEEAERLAYQAMDRLDDDDIDWDELDDEGWADNERVLSASPARPDYACRPVDWSVEIAQARSIKGEG